MKLHWLSDSNDETTLACIKLHFMTMIAEWFGLLRKLKMGVDTGWHSQLHHFKNTKKKSQASNWSLPQCLTKHTQERSRKNLSEREIWKQKTNTRIVCTAKWGCVSEHNKHKKAHITVEEFVSYA